MELKVHLEKQKVQKATLLEFFVECVFIKLDSSITVMSLGFRFFLYFPGKILFLYQIRSVSWYFLLIFAFWNSVYFHASVGVLSLSYKLTDLSFGHNCLSAT